MSDKDDSEKTPEAKADKKNPPKRSMQALGIAIVATLVCLAADLGSKEWASDNLSAEHPATPPPVCETPGRNQRLRTEPYVIVEDYLELSYAENCGAAFGLLDDAPDGLRRGLFGLAAIAATLILFWMFFMGRGGPWFAYSVPLIVSGAVGNLVDRVRLGYVVDFIRFHWANSWDYPTFNVADITITIGVAMLIIDGFVQEREEKRRRQELRAEAKAKGDEERAKSKKGKKGKTRKKAAEADEES